MVRGEKLLLDGPAAAVTQAGELLTNLVAKLRHTPRLSGEEVRSLIAREQRPTGAEAPGEEEGAMRTYKAAVRARSTGQAQYLRAIETHDIVFAIGPAGTGK
ncbi:MAG: PhoH family protein, partial [Candidatus Latescibacteria bacterium]|nr:PhoH family protein [Candidatus Latescibacterota bacterium]